MHALFTPKLDFFVSVCPIYTYIYTGLLEIGGIPPATAALCACGEFVYARSIYT